MKKIFLSLILIIACNIYSAKNSNQPDPDPIEMEEDIENIRVDISTKKKEITIAYVNLTKDLMNLIPRYKLEEIYDKFTKSISHLAEGEQLSQDETEALREEIKKDLEETLKEVEIEKAKGCMNKLLLSWMIFKQNLSIKTCVKSGIYRVAASLDSILMTWLFITKDISVEAAFKATAVDVVGKYILYYLYERVWASRCFNRFLNKWCSCRRKKPRRQAIQEATAEEKTEHHIH